MPLLSAPRRPCRRGCRAHELHWGWGCVCVFYRIDYWGYKNKRMRPCNKRSHNVIRQASTAAARKAVARCARSLSRLASPLSCPCAESCFHCHQCFSSPPQIASTPLSLSPCADAVYRYTESHRAACAGLPARTSSRNAPLNPATTFWIRTLYWRSLGQLLETPALTSKSHYHPLSAGHVRALPRRRLASR